MTERLIEQVEISAERGTRIRFIHNSGVGEPTLHPEFRERMAMFGLMLRNWKAPIPAPEIAIVTNGSNLMKPGILAALQENDISVYLSFHLCSRGIWFIVFEDLQKDRTCYRRSLLVFKNDGIKVAKGNRRALLNISPLTETLYLEIFLHSQFLIHLASNVGLRIYEW